MIDSLYLANPQLVNYARIELRDTTIRIKDGLAGTAAINDATPATATATTTDIDTVVLNSDVTTLVPVGARFTIAGETAATTVHTVTARTPTTLGPTTNIVFTPALTAGTYVDDGVITFLPQQIAVTVGEGNLTYTESKEYTYDLDRGDLNTVREGNEVPLELSLEFVYDHVLTGTSETITVVDALKGRNGAAEWVSSSSDLCEPYSVDVEIDHATPCGTVQDEVTVFPEFRYDSLEFDLSAATIACTGRCNATEPTITRE